MGRLLLVGLVMAGCYDARPQPLTACSASGACPEPLFCENQVCVATPSVDAAPDAEVDVDGDDDGILDAVDNCPAIANTNQHDEDGDARGDACDLCPHVAQTTFTNADNDGVDDACDPNPMTPGDTIARFEPFTTLPTDLTQSGTWTVSGDEVVQSATGSAGLLVPGSFAHVTAEVGGRIVTTPGASRELKIVAGRTAADVWGSCCFDDTDGAAAKYVLEIEEESAATTIVVTEPARARMATGPFMIRITANTGPKTISCEATEGTTAETAMGTLGVLNPGAIEVKSRSTTYALSYLIVINSP